MNQRRHEREKLAREKGGDKKGAVDASIEAKDDADMVDDADDEKVCPVKPPMSLEVGSETVNVSEDSE